MNRENMEKWIEALENYEGPVAIGSFLEKDGTMCALGVGMAQATDIHQDNFDRISRFYEWLDMAPARSSGSLAAYDVSLKPDGSGFDHVSRANDFGGQSPWTIAQRLRETYLKEES